MRPFRSSCHSSCATRSLSARSILPGRFARLDDVDVDIVEDLRVLRQRGRQAFARLDVAANGRDDAPQLFFFVWRLDVLRGPRRARRRSPSPSPAGCVKKMTSRRVIRSRMRISASDAPPSDATPSGRGTAPAAAARRRAGPRSRPRPCPSARGRCRPRRRVGRHSSVSVTAPV